MIKKIFSVSLLAILLIIQLVLPWSASADGMLMRPDPYADRWDFSPETNQQDFINYEDGVQKMIISIGVEDQANSGVVWIFPVPSSPEKINIDIVSELPELRGEEIYRKAEMVLDGAKSLVSSSQIYPFMFEDLFLTTLVSDGGGKSLDSFGTGGLRNDVEIYKHIEKDGIVSEVITAKTAEGLYNYLKNKGLNVEISPISVLDNYIGKDYSFIVSWISTPAVLPNDPLTAEFIEQNLYKYITQTDIYWRFAEYYDDYVISAIKSITYDAYFSEIERNNVINNPAEAVKYFKTPGTKWGKYYLNKIIDAIQKDPLLINQNIIQKINTNQKGVYVTFPTNKIYFPLIPTSVYGDKIVPASIRVLGHITPEIYNNIKANTTVSYYNQDYLSINNTLKDFFGRNTTDAKVGTESLFLNHSIDYTKIDISVQSKFFTEDLWIKNISPAGVILPNFIINQKWLICFLMLFVVSVITGILSGLVIFKEHRNIKGIKKFGLLGLFNIFTIFGLILAIIFAKTKEGTEEVETLIKEIKKRDYYKKIMIGSFLYYLTLPFLIFIIISFMGVLSYIVEILSHGVKYTSLLPLFFILLVFLVFAISRRLKKIKIEEQLFINQLKNYGYSTTTFVPEDSRKLSFVFLYSISFLVVSWVLFKIIVIAVNI